MSTQFKDLPDDVQQLIFATAIVDSPRTGVALSAVDKRTRELVQQGCVWQPLANAQSVDISQFNPSVHTREIVETHDFQPVADVLQRDANGDIDHEIAIGLKPSAERVEVPRTPAGAREWLRKMDAFKKERLLKRVLWNSGHLPQKQNIPQVLEICRMILQGHRGLSDFAATYRQLSWYIDSCPNLDIAIHTEFVFLFLQHYNPNFALFLHTSPDCWDGTWESILQDREKMDKIFCVTYDLFKEKPALLDSVMRRLFQRGLVPSDFALKVISIRSAQHGKEYKKRMLELQKQIEPSIGKKLLALAQPIFNLFSKK